MIMKKIKYGNLKETEIKEVSVLIEKLFKEFIGPDYSQKGSLPIFFLCLLELGF